MTCTKTAKMVVICSAYEQQVVAMRELTDSDFEIAQPIIERLINQSKIKNWINGSDTTRFIASWKKQSCNKQKLLINMLNPDGWKKLKDRIRQNRFRQNKKVVDDERTTITVSKKNLKRLTGYMKKNKFNSLNETLGQLMENGVILTASNARFVNFMRKYHHQNKTFSGYVNFLLEQKERKRKKSEDWSAVLPSTKAKQ